MVLGCGGFAAGGATVGRALYVVAGDAAGAGAGRAVGADGEDRGVYVVAPFSVLTGTLSGAGAGVEDDPARGV
jgi:hypothetical protein